MNCRAPFQDYRDPSFYLITMVALNRRPLFSTCSDNCTTFTQDGEEGEREQRGAGKRHGAGSFTWG
jgi:hypothetical protein